LEHKRDDVSILFVRKYAMKLQHLF
jgi:hypothetical protein